MVSIPTNYLHTQIILHQFHLALGSVNIKFFVKNFTRAHIEQSEKNLPTI